MKFDIFPRSRRRDFKSHLQRRERFGKGSITEKSSGLGALEASEGSLKRDGNQTQYLYATLVILPFGGRLLARRRGNRTRLCCWWGWLRTHATTILEDKGTHSMRDSPTPRRNTINPSFLKMKRDLLAHLLNYSQYLPNYLPSWLSLLCPFRSFLGLFVWNADGKKVCQVLTKQILIPF